MNEDYFYKRKFYDQPLPTGPRFPISLKFSNQSRPNYKDNSLQKSQKSKDFLKHRKKFLSLSKEELSSIKSKHQLLHQKVKSFADQYFEYKNSLKAFETTEIIQELAATKIQKHIRGYLIRKRLESLFISSHKNSYNKNIKDLVQSSEYCLFFVGKKIKQSVILIQRAIRRKFFLKKIERIAQVYYWLKKAKKDAKSLKLRFLLKNLAANTKILHLKWLNYRTITLEKIRRKLAVLTIKTIIKREKVNLRLMKLKIRKYRRNNTNSLKRKQSKIRKSIRKKTISIENSPLFRPSSQEDETVEETVPNLEELEEKENELIKQEERREKISLGLISYNIRKNRYRFYRKIRNNSLDDHTLNIQRKSIKLPLIQNKIPEVPAKIVKNKKYRSKSNEKHYLNPTVSSVHNQFVPTIEPQEKLVKNFKFKEKASVLLPTVSFLKKKTSKILPKTENFK